MKKLSLQWRLTLMTAILVTAACLLLHFFISNSAVMRIDEMENYILEIKPENADSYIVGMNFLEIYPDFPEQMLAAKRTFYLQSFFATLAVILASSALTYFLAGRALAPLRQFSSHMEKIQAQNLSKPLEIPKTEDEVACLTRDRKSVV